MRNALFAVLLLPVLALAAGNLYPVTTVAPEGVQPDAAPLPRVEAGTPALYTVGDVDTIGGTTYDWQTNGPYYRMLANAPGYGVHAAWMFSASDQMPSAPDRNLRYNFYDYSLGEWNWIDPDYMASGVNVFTDRYGYGNLDVESSSGVAIISGHTGDPIHVDVAKDMIPGAGIFDYCLGTPNMEYYLWGYISTDMNGAIHTACLDDPAQDNLFYSHCDPWCTWMAPVSVPAPQPEPVFPNQSIAASKVSQKVCVTWEYSEGNPDPGFYRLSTDGGANWGPATELEWPDAYGTDTLTSFHITSFFPFYDRDDKLHIAAGVGPVVAGTGLIIPAQIWHWSPDNTPNWSHVTTATIVDTLNLLAPVGYNALYACRPCLGEDSRGNLFVAWEQFDSTNIEPGPPEVMRADIFIAGSADDGVTWGDAVKLTDGGTGSHRFPSIIDMAVSGGADPDTVWVSYMVDLVAAFAVQEEGPVSNNPIIVQKVPVDSILAVGVQEPGAGTPARLKLAAVPNPFGMRTTIRYALPNAGRVTLAVYDAAGRPVRTLAAGMHAAGSYRVAWNGRSDDGREVAAGIYFYKLETDLGSLTEKLVVAR